MPCWMLCCGIRFPVQILVRCGAQRCAHAGAESPQHSPPPGTVEQARTQFQNTCLLNSLQNTTIFDVFEQCGTGTSVHCVTKRSDTCHCGIKLTSCASSGCPWSRAALQQRCLRVTDLHLLDLSRDRCVAALGGRGAHEGFQRYGVIGGVGSPLLEHEMCGVCVSLKQLRIVEKVKEQRVEMHAWSRDLAEKCS